MNLKVKKNNFFTVYLPNHIVGNKNTGELLGYYISETESYNIIGLKTEDIDTSIYPNINIIGEISDNLDEDRKIDFLHGYWKEGILHFLLNEEKDYKLIHYDIHLDVFSRNSGILETEVMNNKCAIISGCGSVGSLVALELARTGVGRFILIDNDIFSYHNICRHQCSILDVGKYKTTAVKQRILQINPNAKVIESTTIIENTPKQIFDQMISNDSIIIGCADNREGDLYANQISMIFKIPFISIGFWERAFAGEIFYKLDKKMPCYNCFYQTIGASGISGRTSTNRRIYTEQEDLSKVSFEPGISTDINFITSIAIKLIIDILNVNNKVYKVKVLDYLKQFTLISNTNNPDIGGEKAEIFSHPLQITNSIEIDFVNNCDHCKISK